MRFRFLGGSDAPDWILAEVSILAKMVHHIAPTRVTPHCPPCGPRRPCSQRCSLPFPVLAVQSSVRMKLICRQVLQQLTGKGVAVRSHIAPPLSPPTRAAQPSTPHTAVTNCAPPPPPPCPSPLLCVCAQYDKVAKLTSSSRVQLDVGDVKALIATLHFIFASAAKHNVNSHTLLMELEQLGLPKGPLTALPPPLTPLPHPTKAVLRYPSLTHCHVPPAPLSPALLPRCPLLLQTSAQPSCASTATAKMSCARTSSLEPSPVGS